MIHANIGTTTMKLLETIEFSKLNEFMTLNIPKEFIEEYENIKFETLNERLKFTIFEYYLININKRYILNNYLLNHISKYLK